MTARIIITGKASAVFDRLKAMAGQAVPVFSDAVAWDSRAIDRDALEQERREMKS
jgi:hypothetical protein